MASQFELDLQRFGAAIKHGYMAQIVAKVAFDLAGRIIMRTPVDTGLARGNWQVAIGAEPTTSVMNEDKSGTSTATAAGRAVRGWKPGDGDIFFVNNLVYITALEEGHSQQQAPQGMVAVTLEEYPYITAAAATEHGGG